MNEQFELKLIPKFTLVKFEAFLSDVFKDKYDNTRFEHNTDGTYDVRIYKSGVLSVFTIDPFNATVTINSEKCTDSFLDSNAYPEPPSRPLASADEFHQQRKSDLQTTLTRIVDEVVIDESET